MLQLTSTSYERIQYKDDDGSIQGLTQVVNQNSASNNNLVSSQITMYSVQPLQT